ncbi:hypothetical protein [Ottowia sp.]|uniref:hypothetical protein n=1 Tax=Ottowia sp. TaxID=1898956 RepID=UPI0039E62501
MALNWFSPRPGARRHAALPIAEPAKPNGRALAEQGPAADAAAVAWPDVVRQLGQEVAMSLNAAAEQLERLNRLEPSLVRSLIPVSESVERARQAGMAAQHVLRLCEDPPPQQRELLNLADVARAALTARGDWFARRQVSVRQGLAQTRVYADSSMLYMLVDELLMWAGALSSDIAVNVDKSARTGRPRLRVAAWCVPTAVPDTVWRSMRWVLWHQLARTVGAASQLTMREDHVRVTLSLPPVTEEQLATGIEESVGPSSVSAVIQGCRVLIVADSAQRRAQCLQALAGYGLILDSAEDMAQAERLAAQHLPDAVVYDQGTNASQIERLRDSLLQKAGTPAAFIEIHDDAGASEFQASTVGTISTGYVAAKSLNQALGPALVFELCKVM